MSLPLLFAALAMCVLPGVANAKKDKPDKPRVATFNLYLGTDLPNVDNVFNNPAFGTSALDRGANAIGFSLNDVNLNDFDVRAKAIAKQVKKKKLDLIGLQEASIWKVQIPTDLTPVNPAGVRAGLTTFDYIESLLRELNKKANTKSECAQERKDANDTPGQKDDRKAEECYRGYKVVTTRMGFDAEFFGDFDNNCGTVKPGCGLGPAFESPFTGGGTNGPPSWGGDAETNPGSDDTGIFFIDPTIGPPFPVPFVTTSDYNADVDANCDMAVDAGATVPPQETDEGINVAAPGGPACSLVPGVPDVSDCPDSNLAGGFLTPSAPVGPNTTDNTSSCFIHGIDGDASLTIQDAILARKGNGVKVKNPQTGNYASQFSASLLGGRVVLPFTRGWTSADARVRGKKFHFVNTHLESEDTGTIREDQASELAAGPAAQPKTVLVGDLNSDPNSADPESPPAINRLIAAGLRKISGTEATSGHAGSRAYADAGETGALLNDSSNTATESNIDHIMTNSPKISKKGCGLIDKFKNGLWLSDHVFVCAGLKIK